jgi:hypothetical protein
MNDVNIKEYIDARFASLEKYIDVKFVALEKRLEIAYTTAQNALSKSDAAAEKRFESLNEFRSVLKDQQATFLVRNEYEANHKQLESRVEGVQKIVYIGLGGVLVLQILLKFLVFP